MMCVAEWYWFRRNGAVSWFKFVPSNWHRRSHQFCVADDWRATATKVLNGNPSTSVTESETRRETWSDDTNACGTPATAPKPIGHHQREKLCFSTDYYFYLNFILSARKFAIISFIYAMANALAIGIVSHTFSVNAIRFVRGHGWDIHGDVVHSTYFTWNDDVPWHTQCI